MKGLILLVNGFEESEAIITIDLLRRANIEIDLVSLTNSLTVTSSGNITVSCDKLYSITKLEDYNFLVIPGGKAVFNYHLDSIVTKEIVDYFMSKNLVVAAICAAPMILGKYGYLKEESGKLIPNIVIVTKGNGNKELDNYEKLLKLRDEIVLLMGKAKDISRGYIIDQALELGWLKFDENTINTVGAYIYK